MSKSEIRATLTLDASQFNSAMSQVQSGIKNMTSNMSSAVSNMGSSIGSKMQSIGSSIQSMGSSLSKAGQNITKAGVSMVAAFTPLAGILTGSVRAAMKYEDAILNVSRTTGLGGDALEDFKKRAKELTRELPYSEAEIANVAAVIGQLGISAPQDLAAVTKVALQMQDSFEGMNAEEAATGVAQFLNITGSGIGTVSQLGSAIAKLGDGTATTERHILELGNRIASAGTMAGLSDSEMMAWSATILSMGINVEAGGSSFSRFVNDVSKACATGGDKLNKFAEVAGMSGAEFQRAFEQDANGALISVVQGLAELEQSGGNVQLTLDELGFSEIRVSNLMRALTKSAQENADGNILLTDAMNMSNDAYGEAIKLQEEADKKNSSLSKKIQGLKSHIENFGKTVGELSSGTLNDIVTKLDEFVQGLDEGDAQVVAMAGAIGVAGVAIGTILIPVGQLVSVLGSIASGIGTVVSGIGGLVSGFGGLSGVLAAIASPITIVVAAIVAIGAALVYCWNNVESFRESVTESFSRIGAVIGEVSSTIWGYLQEVWGAISPWLIPMLQDMAATIGNIFDTIMVIISTVVDAVWSKIQAVWGAIQPYAVTIFGGIAEFLGGIWEVISGIINGACDFIKAVIEGDWDAAKEAILNAGQKMWDGVVQCWDAIKGTVTDVCKMVYDTIKDKWDSMLNAIKDKLSSMKTEAEQKWNDIKTAVSNKCSDIKTDLEQKWNDMKTAVSQKCSDIKTDAVEKWNNIKSDVGSAMSDLKSDISSKWSDIKSDISSTASDILSAIKQPFVDGWNAIKSIPGDIMNAFSSIKISIPTPRLPQINVGSKEVFGISIPTFSVSWNAKGAFFDKASIVGMGEAGKEAILPLENKRYMKPYATAVASLMNDMNSTSGETVYNNIEVKQMVVREEADIKRVAEELQRLQDRENRRRRGRDD